MRTLRYVRSWKSGADVEVQDLEFEREGTSVPATLMLPSRRSGPLPGWVALGGVSRMGRKHPQLVRFAEALASSGAAVLVPEVPEWRALDITPRPTIPTIRGCLDLMDKRAEVAPGGRGLIGFSFGAPQVAIAAAQPDLAPRIAGIVLFGGYCCLARTLCCQLTGDHSWEGVDYKLRPDPYGRWVVGSNHLTKVPGYEDASDVAAALHGLASAASGKRIPAWEPRHDEMIKELRCSLPDRRRATFDLFAVESALDGPDHTECRDMAGGLAAAARSAEPLLEPDPYLKALSVPVRLIHGQGDRLIPFTEGMRLRESLPAGAVRDLTVTGLFNHSADRAPDSMLAHAREKAVFLRALRGVINTA